MSCFSSRFLLAKPAGCKVAGCAHPHPFAQVHRLMIEPDWLMKEPPAGSFLPSLPSKLRDTTDQFIWESPKTGLPCNPTHFRDVFRKSLEEAGDVRLLTPHSCRHTYVSQMQALGVDIQTIQSIVGHADTEMTEHYLHVQESIRQSAIQLFSEAFSA